MHDWYVLFHGYDLTRMYDIFRICRYKTIYMGKCKIRWTRNFEMVGHLACSSRAIDQGSHREILTKYGILFTLLIADYPGSISRSAVMLCGCGHGFGPSDKVGRGVRDWSGQFALIRWCSPNHIHLARGW